MGAGICEGRSILIVLGSCNISSNVSTLPNFLQCSAGAGCVVCAPVLWHTRV